MRAYVMGNGAIALGALAAGINLAAGYPGTPSSEIMETLSKYPHEGVHLEWSVNEKAAMEVAAAAAYSSARALVTMKQVGLNVASDPLMSLAYVGVKGGMVIVCADDPGPISSQTEQDTRRFADFCRIPVFDPSSVEEAYQMIQDAFAYSEKYHTPVLFRPTTRICHAYAAIDIPDTEVTLPSGQSYPGSMSRDGTARIKDSRRATFESKVVEGFIKDSSRWVIFPALSRRRHSEIEAQNVQIGRDFSAYLANHVSGGAGPKAVVTSGVSYGYVKECLKDNPDLRLIRVATAFPFPEDFMLNALEGVEEVLCIEELSPYLEEQILKLCGKKGLSVKVSGKLDGKVPHSSEMSVELAADILKAYAGIPSPFSVVETGDAPRLPIRPPVLCAGCPHRASFYAVKQAVKGREAVFCGDIGCYTLGNAMPLDMVDTCLCMGAGITMAQGFSHTNPDTLCFAFVGDSTFFASGMTGVVNAVYNEADIILCVLDNSTTAMTGHQPHPGTGRNMQGHVVDKVDIGKVLEAIGVGYVTTVDPLDLTASVRAVRECAKRKGVKAIIFKSPCVAITKPEHKCIIDPARCINCKKCIREIGCPAISLKEGRPHIHPGLCTGCGLCGQVCPAGAIGGEKHE